MHKKTFIKLFFIILLTFSHIKIFGMQFLKLEDKLNTKKPTLKELNLFYRDLLINNLFSNDDLKALEKNLNSIETKDNINETAIKNSLLDEVKRQIKNNFTKDFLARSNTLLEFLNKNKNIIWKNEFKVNDISNRIFQIKVNHQQLSNTCGPRAAFNCYMLSKYFYPDNNDPEKATLILDNWAQSAKLTLLNTKSTNGKNPVFGFLDEVKKIINRDPQNLHSAELEDVVEKYKKENEKLKFENISIIDGYQSIEPKMLIGIMTNGYDFGYKLLDFEGKQFFDGKVTERKIGYYHSFVITEGDSERKDKSLNSCGHWFSLFGIKTDKNKYDWFIMDSLNTSYEKGKNKIKIEAYINKFLGNEKFNEYEKTINSKNKSKFD